MRNSSNYKWVILLVIFLLGINNVYFQYQLTPLADVICKELNLSLQQYSALFSAPMAPAIFISLICGLIVDRFGAKRVIAFALFIQAIGIWGRLFARSFSVYYFCMFIPGFACTFLNANTAKILGEWFSSKEISIAIGIYFASTAIGQALAVSTSALLPSASRAYIISAIYASIMVFIWIFLYKSKSHHKNLNSKTEKGSFLLADLSAVLRNKDIILTCIIIMCVYGGFLNLAQFMPSILKSKGFEESSAGAIASFISYGQLGGSLFGPAVVTKTGRISKHIVLFSLFAAICTVSLRLFNARIVVALLLVAIGFCVGTMLPILMSIPMSLNGVGIEKAGTAGGMISTFMLFGAVVLPQYVIVPLSKGSWNRLISLGMVIFLIAAILPKMYSKNICAIDC